MLSLLSFSAATYPGITDLLGTAVAEYGSTDSDAADQESAPAADQEEGSQASARAVSPVVNVPWLPEVGLITQARWFSVILQ
jgi:hypothetical protein